jgi:hypothetical protein
MNVAYLGATGPLFLPCRFVSTFHQPAVGREVLHGRETIYVMDLVEHHQAQYLPHAVD